MTDEPLVLLADNSEEDTLLMRTVFGRAGFVQPLRAVRDGEEAIAYLQGAGAYGDRKSYPLPTILLLDLNMPRKNGFEVLQWIRAQPSLRRLRVYILSASSRAEDIDRAYDLGANSYLVKPSSLNELTNMTRCLIAWLKISEFAPLAEGGEYHELAPADSAVRYA